MSYTRPSCSRTANKPGVRKKDAEADAVMHRASSHLSAVNARAYIVIQLSRLLPRESERHQSVLPGLREATCRYVHLNGRFIWLFYGTVSTQTQGHRARLTRRNIAFVRWGLQGCWKPPYNAREEREVYESANRRYFHTRTHTQFCYECALWGTHESANCHLKKHILAARYTLVNNACLTDCPSCVSVWQQIQEMSCKIVELNVGVVHLKRANRVKMSLKWDQTGWNSSSPVIIHIW